MATTLSSQEVNNTRFNKEAAEWDANKKHVESTEKAFEAIKRYVPAFADESAKGIKPLRDAKPRCLTCNRP